MGDRTDKLLSFVQRMNNACYKIIYRSYFIHSFINTSFDYFYNQTTVKIYMVAQKILHQHIVFIHKQKGSVQQQQLHQWQLDRCFIHSYNSLTSVFFSFINQRYSLIFFHFFSIQIYQQAHLF